MICRLKRNFTFDTHRAVTNLEKSFTRGQSRELTRGMQSLLWQATKESREQMIGRNHVENVL